jgi:cell pole-organizing protein PopZ
MVSGATEAAVEEAFGRLAATPVPPTIRSLEEAVSEMLRPMLKSWLDDNLPTLVERLVKAEIERLTRGR